jgi:hypothetical protein
METKKSALLCFVQVSLIAALVMISLVFNSCGTDEKECRDAGGINLDFSHLPSGFLPAVFTVDKVTGIRIYDRVKRAGSSLWLTGIEEFPPGSGNKKDAAVMLLFSQLPCHVSAITAEVHGHGSEARIMATQRDGTTQTTVCTGGRQVLTLNATRDNPFIWVILSGQEAEWLKFQLE